MTAATEAPYAGDRVVYDADSHLMELPGWLVEYADPDVRELIRPLYLGGAGALADDAIAQAEARRADGEHAGTVEIMSDKGWHALGAFDAGRAFARIRSARLRGAARVLDVRAHPVPLR